MTASVHSAWRPRQQRALRARAPIVHLDPSRRAAVRSPHRTVRPRSWALPQDGLVAALAATAVVGPRSAIAYSVLWVLAVAVSRGYEARLVPPGHEDVARIVRAAVGIAAAGAALSATAAAPLSVSTTGWLAMTAATALLSLTHRGLEWTLRARVAPEPVRVIVAGRAKDARRFRAELERPSRRPLEVIGLCVPKERVGDPVEDVKVTVGLDQLPQVALDQGAQAVIVLPCRTFSPPAVRRLSWALAEARIQLFLAPGLIDVDQRRATVLSSGSVGMVHVRAPELRGIRRTAAELASRLLAIVLVVVLIPLFVLIAIAVRLDSPGPVLYRNVRIGRGGAPFTMWKFRTMQADADARLVDLHALNEADGLLFKMHLDPRVTRLGRWLRHYSLDELPQLVNVALGTMTLVGPRPALPCEVAAYDGDVHRRLAVKPGITGLWQVSGRSDLSWAEGIRLDLAYVDNWSWALDLRILARTVRAVLRPTGAY